MNLALLRSALYNAFVSFKFEYWNIVLCALPSFELQKTAAVAKYSGRANFHSKRIQPTSLQKINNIGLLIKNNF